MRIRHLTPADAPKAAPLLSELGYPVTAAVLAERLAAVTANSGDEVLVAEEEGVLLGLVALHSFEMLHRPGRLGRITALVVAASARGRGIGSELLRTAESRLIASGCTKLEVTSGEQRSEAHRFYVARGYREQRVRFVKSAAT